MVTLDDIKQIIKEGYSFCGYGRLLVAAAGTNQRITTHSSKVAAILIKALTTNGGIIYVGFDDEVSAATGYELEAGDPLTIPIDDINKVWFDSSVNGEGISYIIVK